MPFKLTANEKEHLANKLPARIVVLIVFIVLGAAYGNLDFGFGEWIAGAFVTVGILFGDLIIDRFAKK